MVDKEDKTRAFGTVASMISCAVNSGVVSFGFSVGLGVGRWRLGWGFLAGLTGTGLAV